MLLAVSSLLGIGFLVCWIMEVVTAFQKGNGPLLGILSIVLTCCGGIGGIVIGWIKCKEWGIQNLMIIWTIIWVAQIVVSGFQQAELMEMLNQMSNGPQ